MGHLTLDVRTKLILILYASVVVFAFYSIWMETALVVMIGGIQLYLKKSAGSLRLIIIYTAFLLVQVFLLPELSGTVLTMISFFVVSARRLFPCAMAGILLINTTTVSELTAGLGKLGVPRQIIIPLAVTLRYIPAVKEEFSHIKDAAKLRKIKIRKKNFIKSISQRMECYYVPLLVSASQISEELSASAITRGIENPCKKTFLYSGHFGLADGIVIAILIFLLAGIIKLKYFGGGFF